jgi:hypothetical protein
MSLENDQTVLVINDGYDFDNIFFNNLSNGLIKLKVTNLVSILQNLPTSLELLEIHNYSQEAKETIKIPYGCNVIFTGIIIPKQKIKLNFNHNVKELIWLLRH